MAIWHGASRRRCEPDAATYEAPLREEILPGIAAKRLPGYHGAHLLRHDADGEVEFVTILWFDSLDGVRALAGEDYETAYVPPKARAVLARFDARSTHYETVLSPQA